MEEQNLTCVESMISRGYISFGDLDTAEWLGFKLTFVSIVDGIVTIRYAHECLKGVFQFEFKRELETITKRTELEQKTRGRYIKFECTLKITYNDVEIPLKNHNGLMDTSKDCTCFRRKMCWLPLWDSNLFKVINKSYGGLDDWY